MILIKVPTANPTKIEKKTPVFVNVNPRKVISAGKIYEVKKKQTIAVKTIEP